jgi:hypothetical protein
MLPSVPLQPTPGAQYDTGRNTTRRQETSHSVQLYGWDSLTGSWHGPNELALSDSGGQKLLASLRAAPGKSWFGPVVCRASRQTRSRFFAVIHSLDDCAVAMLYCSESKAGPAEIVTVVPSGRRRHLREEFAFEFVAFSGFLGCLGPGGDLAVHDRIAAALAETSESESLVFSLSTGLWTGDLDFELSRCVETVAVSMLRWLEQ